MIQPPASFEGFYMEVDLSLLPLIIVGGLMFGGLVIAVFGLTIMTICNLWKKG